MKYKFLDEITSDVLFEAYGKDLKEVFENSAEALFTVICKLDKVEAKDERTVEVKADNTSDLMFSWLQELIALVDVEEMFFSKFEIIEIDEKHLKAKIYGEPVVPEKGETVVKALTLYRYGFKKIKEGYKTTVSLDI